MIELRDALRSNVAALASCDEPATDSTVSACQPRCAQPRAPPTVTGETSSTRANWPKRAYGNLVHLDTLGKGQGAHPEKQKWEKKDRVGGAMATPRAAMARDEHKKTQIITQL